MRRARFRQQLASQAAKCIRISYADEWSRIERGLEIVIEEVRRARDSS